MVIPSRFTAKSKRATKKESRCLNAQKHGGVQETFTVRRIAHGCGIERVFPVHSPNVDHVEVVRSGHVRRAKLYYLRDRVGKAAKVKSKIK